MWYETHVDECIISHSGSSGKMEISAITQMFLRSMENYGIKYLTYIGNGTYTDSKTYKRILDAKPYRDTVITKKEWVGHVERRTGTWLRAVKKDKTNKGIGGIGPGKLADKVIRETMKFYVLAIRRHPDSLEDMKKEVWATYYHKCSSDENAWHQFCPEGEDGCFKWRKAKTKVYKHDQFHHGKPPLIPEVQVGMKYLLSKIYRNTNY